jgi:hypothetical protein
MRRYASSINTTMRSGSVAFQSYKEINMSKTYTIKDRTWARKAKDTIRNKAETRREIRERIQDDDFKTLMRNNGVVPIKGGR